MHAGSGLVDHRLGHERGDLPHRQRHLLDHGAKGDDVVGRGERVGVAQVDLVLTRTVLVMGELDLDVHRLQVLDGGAAEVLALAAVDVVEVAGLVHRPQRGALLVGLLEEVELDLGVGVELQPLLLSAGEGILQHAARIGGRGLAVGGEDVAHHAAGRVGLAAPGQQLEGRGVRAQDHVGLVAAGEALDGGAVDADALGEGDLEVRRRDRDRLQRPRDVAEPQPDEPHVLVGDGADDVVMEMSHGASLPQVPGAVRAPGSPGRDAPRSPEGGRGA